MARQAYLQAPANHCKGGKSSKATHKSVQAPVLGKARKLAGPVGRVSGEANETVQQALVRMFAQIPPHKQLRVAMLLLTIIFIYEMIERDRQLQEERQAVLAGYREASLESHLARQASRAAEAAVVVKQHEGDCGAQQPGEVACEPIGDTTVAGPPPTSNVARSGHGVVAIQASSGSRVMLRAFACVLSAFQQHLAYAAAIVTLHASGLVGITCTVAAASTIRGVERLSSVCRLVSPRSSAAA